MQRHVTARHYDKFTHSSKNVFMPLQQIVHEVPRDTRRQLLDVVFPSASKFLALYMILEY